MRGIHIFCLILCISATWSKSINDKIIGGQDAKPGQFPYQVVWCEEFLIQGYTFCTPLCGGSILDKNTVITSGECCEFYADPIYGADLNNTFIIAGELDIGMPIEVFEQVREIKDYLIYPHDTYISDNMTCLLTLDTPLEWNENVQGIELDDHDPLDSTTCQVSGWGIDHFSPNNNTAPTTLQWTEVEVRSDYFCHALMELSYDPSTMICTSTPVSSFMRSFFS